jgi:2-hydroxycyclohexanecarboxyl-CoA dehydrogenase
MTERAIPRILITGGSSGIGLAAAMRLSRSPCARIVINSRDAARGEAACARLREAAPHAAVSFVAADVSDKPSVVDFMTQAREWLGGPIDVLVNSAGGDFVPGLFHETSLEAIDDAIRQWLLSTMYCCRIALPQMSDGGAIINVASDAAKVPTPGEAVVGAAMAGVAMLSRTLAMEAKRRRIRVNVVTPSLVRGTQTYERVTEGGFSAKLFEKATRAAHLGLPEADEVAAIIAFLAGPDAARMTGQVISVNGGISAG